MKLSVLFTANAIVALAFGIAATLFPAELVGAFGISLTPGTALVVRLTGTAYVGLGLLSWLAHAAAASEALQAILLARFIEETLSFLVAVYGVLSGASNPLGWLVVALFGLFAAGFASFAFRKGCAGEAGLHRTPLTAK